MEEDFYGGTYKAMFYSDGSSAVATKFLHTALERYPNRKHLSFPLTLEIGGGEGLHFKYVHSEYDLYLLSDVRTSPLSPEAEMAKNSGKLQFIVENAERLSLENSTIDRVIFSCVLHHLNNPEAALNEARRVLKSGGMISIYLPCDPGFIYRQLRKVFTSRRSRTLGIDYELINVREHINHYYQLNKLIKEVFKEDVLRIRRFPFQFLNYDLNIFSIIHISINKS